MRRGGTNRVAGFCVTATALSCPADVADRERPSVLGDREDVVEVAADFHARTAHVDDGDLHGADDPGARHRRHGDCTRDVNDL